MEVKSVKKAVGTIYFLVDDNNRPIMPVYRFMLHMLSNGFSSNTSKTYAQHLKLYYEWLSLVGLDYHTAVGVGQNKKSVVLSNLSTFKFWLKYPDYDEKLTPINGYVAKRQAITVNQIMNAVLSFYDFLEFDEGIETLHLYKESRTNSQFGFLLSEMIRIKEKKLTSVLKEKVPKKKIEYVTRSQYELLYEKATNQRNRIIIGLMFEGGLRVSEVIGLNISDLRDIGNNKIYITKRNDPNNPDSAVKYDSEGVVFVSDALAREINNYLIETLSDIDTDYAIINLYSDTNKYQPMKRDTIEDMVSKLGKKAGIEGLHPHMLRHGLAVDMLQKGSDMVEIKDTLRHKSVETTASIYAKADTPTRQAAMKTYYDKANKEFHPDGMSTDEFVDFLLQDMED